MPYLTEQRKDELDYGRLPTTPGDLTYRLTSIALHAEPDQWLEYMKGEITRYLSERPYNFASLSQVVGCIACARMEWSRRMPADNLKVLWWTTVEASFYSAIVAPYEDTKITANGDVYPQQKEDPITCDSSD